MARVSKSVTLSEEAMQYVEEQAQILFSGNISACLNYIVMKDKNNIVVTKAVQQKEEKKIGSKAASILNKTDWVKDL